MQLVNQYNQLNNSFKKTLVFRIGSEAGFFSEYNNMILAMLYCLEHQIKFELYSADANFGFEKGWQDYFIPFCEESISPNHSKYNHRQPFELSLLKKISILLFKRVSKVEYLTHDLWNKFHNNDFEKKYFDFQLLDIKGNILEICSCLVKMTWKYNEETKNKIDKIVESVQLPDSYISIHVRRGDKSIECENIDLNRYFNLLNKSSVEKNIFVSTDDYSVVENLRNDYPNYNYFTLCPVNRYGYFQKEFDNLCPNAVKVEMYELFASIEIMCNSEMFIGTFKSNIGMYLGMRLNSEIVKSVDLENWTIW